MSLRIEDAMSGFGLLGGSTFEASVVEEGKLPDLFGNRFQGNLLEYDYFSSVSRYLKVIYRVNDRSTDRIENIAVARELFSIGKVLDLSEITPHLSGKCAVVGMHGETRLRSISVEPNCEEPDCEFRCRRTKRQNAKHVRQKIETINTLVVELRAYHAMLPMDYVA